MAVVAAVSPCPRSWIFSPGPASRGGSTAAGLAVVAGGAADVGGAFVVVVGAADDMAGAADVAGAFVVAAGAVLGAGGLPFTCRTAETAVEHARR